MYFSTETLLLAMRKFIVSASESRTLPLNLTINTLTQTTLSYFPGILSSSVAAPISAIVGKVILSGSVSFIVMAATGCTL